MTREEKCLLAIERGYTYNPETGDVVNKYGNIIKVTRLGYIYIRMSVDNKEHKLQNHIFAWYWVNKECVKCLDHINNIRSDNRIINLRSVTQQQNVWNRKDVKGYSFNKKSNRWKASIRINYKGIHLGYFDNEEDARDAYLEAKLIHHII